MSLFFDSSALISLAVTCSLPLLRKLKSVYGGNFYITDAVYNETIGRSASSLRFRYEGYRLKELIEDGTLQVYPDESLKDDIKWLMDTINSSFLADGKPVAIVQLGEMSAIIACIKEKGDSVIVDERTARLLVENSDALKPWLEHKLHTEISIDSEPMDEWKAYVSGKFIPLRSTELAVAGWKKGVFGNNKDILFGLLWALKFAGCAIAEDEIESYLKSL